MGRTVTPELDPEALGRLYGYALEFRPLFPRSDQFRQGRVYLHGLLLDGERKSIEPLSRRVPGGNEQALQQFVNQSPWDPAPILAAYRARMAAAFATPESVIVIDDTGFPKQGTHSVGVARQYSGTLGKTANCQVAVSLHYATAAADYPLALRLYLPETWTGAPERLGRARVPEPERAFKTKWQIALDLLDLVRAEGLPHAVVVADAGYGVVTEFREGLEQRGERYIVGLLGDEVVLTEPPRWVAHVPKGRRGRPATRAYLAADAPRPVPVRELAGSLERTTVCWRAGTKGKLAAEFAWVRVWPAHRWQDGVPADAIPAPEETALVAGRVAEGRHDQVRAVELAAGDDAGAGRAPVEGAVAGRARLRAAQGRARPRPLRGPQLERLPSPRHADLPRLRLPGPGAPPRPRRAGGAAPGGSRPRRVTLPGVRRALQQFLEPPCRLPCPACREYLSGYT
jgi:SRSO17 transposase